MKYSRTSALLIFVLSSFVPCLAHHMAIVVNKDNNTAEVTSSHLAKIFQLETRKWADGKDITIVLHRSLAGETVTLERLNKMSGNELRSFIAAHKDSIMLVDSDDDVLHFVETTPGAVGLVEVHSIDEQVNVLKVDGKLPMEAGYLPH